MESGGVEKTPEKFRFSRERGGGMVICVCGLIGAGKSTFSKRYDGVVSDFDEIKNKQKQIDFTLKKDKAGMKVYHITCYPTPEEVKAFDDRDVEYVWINTSQTQAMINIVKRGRERDIKDVKKTKEKNRQIAEKYLHSNIHFRVVDIFDGGERW